MDQSSPSQATVVVELSLDVLTVVELAVADDTSVDVIDNLSIFPPL